MQSSPLIRRPVALKVSPCVCKAQPSVRAAPDVIGVMIVLSVVLPGTSRAYLEGPTFSKRDVTAAWTRVRASPWGQDDAIHGAQPSLGRSVQCEPQRPLNFHSHHSPGIDSSYST